MLLPLFITALIKANVPIAAPQPPYFSHKPAGKVVVTALLSRSTTWPDTTKRAESSRGVALPKVKQTFKQQMLMHYATSDTARAIINLFAKRQGGGALWVIMSGLYTARGLVAAQGAYRTTINGVVVEERDADVTPVVLIGSLGAGYGVSKLARFSNGRLEQTLQDHSQGKPLPTWIRRRLKPKFFEAPRRMNERR
ncbi:hypothetical protein [Hymenobacter glacieicola]|uniref:hypothetical protein n=1 Tax=Hymenobacter glacieicola TaxID=1562124 RepID=UPI00166CB5E2|nr:hypothetical protein [Hymenobacter glacieicola]